ncbi:quinol monooxygenase YgiN [Paraburkholderia sp. EB58]|jgi:quinol monooxygenase YgiN|uniref:putative quinol monooxygenase n=1 Tax=Paraburkholderia sp. EB58 TaxID=3035125 RepID=UPI003D21D5B0
MSSEIRVVAIVQGKPGTADAIEQVLLRCVAPSRAETGCLLYTPHRDLNRADQFVFFERWASRAALAQHERTEHFKQLVRELTPLVVKPLDVTILEALLDD